MKLVFVAAFAATLFADVAGTIYVSLDIDHTTIGTGTEESFSAYIDSIRTSGGGIVYSAGECLHEYQAFRLHSGSRQIADLDNDSVSLCTGSPCYRSYY
ncbi:hypothetical protein J7L01_05910, partial [bacterium]|nr:hypothetical protein [bacterium]